MTASAGPTVSVGIPVYNGSHYLRQTLTGLLTQTYSDIEVIVSDNASTDSTREILSEIQAGDPRLRVHLFDTNQGPAANYNKVAELARGTYFMWAAADDVHAPTFIERAVAHLDADPSAVLAYAGTRIIDEAGEVKGDFDYEPDIDAPEPAARLDALLNVDHRRHGAFEIFGLMRLAALREVLPQGAYARSDSVILVRMALRGRFVRDPERLFLNRDHVQRSVRSVPARSYRGRGILVGVLGAGPIPADEWWDASRRDRAVWPEWKLLGEYQRAIRDAPLSPSDRAAARKVLRRYSIRHIPKLARDVAINAELGLRSGVARVGALGRRNTKPAQMTESL